MKLFREFPGSSIFPISSDAPSVRARRVETLLFLLLLLCYVWPIDLDPGPNVRAHVDQAAAIVMHHTLAIDAFMKPPEGPNTVDWSRGRDNHIYPAKAPGSALAAVPVVAVLYYAESALGVRPFSGDWFRRNTVLINWALNSLVSALAMVVLLRIVLAIGVPIAAALAGVLSIGLGTAYYPYATTYFAHNPAANLIIAAAFFAFTAAPSATRDALVGLLAGFAVVFDYAAGFAVLLFGMALAMIRPRALVPFVAGGLVPLATLAWYHTAVFGGPAITAYGSLNPRIAPPQGHLLRVPDFRTLLSLTVSPYRGIFFYSPVLLLAIAGAWHALRRRPSGWWRARSLGDRDRRRTIVWAGLLLFVLLFAFNACYYIWWGGWTAGSRYIIPGLVLLAPAIALGFQLFPRLGLLLLTISVANHLAISTVLIMVSHRVKNPLAEVIYPALWRGDFQRSNLGTFLFGLEGLWSLVVLLLPAAGIAFLLARELAARGVREPAASQISRADLIEPTSRRSKTANTAL